MVRVLATLSGLAASARAESVDAPPAIAVLVGPAVRRARLENTRHGDPSIDQDPAALVATVSYRVSPHVAFGVHASVARTGGNEEYDGFFDYETEVWTHIAADVGLAATYEEGRFALTPWLGRHFSRRHLDEKSCTVRLGVILGCDEVHETEWTSDSMSWGVIASVVPFRELPVAVFADLQTGSDGAVLGPESTPRFRYSALSLGIAYRR